MPVKTATKTVKKACKAIRKQWSSAEADHRRETAEQMQRSLVEALGLHRMAPR